MLQFADLVFKGGAALTINEKNDVVSVAAVKDGKIVFTGSDATPLVLVLSEKCPRHQRK